MVVIARVVMVIPRVVMVIPHVMTVTTNGVIVRRVLEENGEGEPPADGGCWSPAEE